MRGSGLLCLAAVALAACGSPAKDRWSPRAGGAFYDQREKRLVQAKEVLEEARRRRQAGDPAGSMRLARLLADHAEDPPTVEAALWLLVELSVRTGRWLQAWQSCLEILHRFPDTGRTRVPPAAFEIGRQAIERGSPTQGAAILGEALQRFPQAESAAEHAMWLARWFLEQELEGETNRMCEFVVREYRKQAVAAEAIFLMGEVWARRYRGVEYDAEPLRHADKKYLQVIQEYPGTEAATRAQERRRWIREQLAEKMLRAGNFYRSRGRPLAAGLYYRRVVGEFPDTRAAAEARGHLNSAAPPAEEPPAPGDRKGE